MLKSYLVLALKNFRKQKLFSLINLLGLAVGIACCLMIFLFITNELSFDRFHQNGASVYRVMRVSNINGEKRNIAWLAPPYARALQDEYPDAIQSVVRIHPHNDLISYQNVSFNEKKIYVADSNFFRFFSFRLLQGDPATVLKDPLSIVMTASAARKYFGSENPIGKTVDLNKELQLKVTGIAEDPPVNSHLEFDMVIPNTHWENTPWYNQWPGNGLYVYVRLHPSVDPAQLEKQFPAFMDKYLGDFYRENGFKSDLAMSPLHDIYLGENSYSGEVKHGSRKMVYIFMSIAILILMIGCVNFMNLATARAADRSKEVGLRKVLGAVRGQLFGQFILESLLFAIMAAIMATGLVWLLMPAYTAFLGYQLPFYWSNPLLYLFLAGTVLAVGMLAGSYPAVMLSSFSPVDSLKGRLKTGKSSTVFRKTLVVFQFSISVLLIISVVVIMNQMHYVRNTDLGFDKMQSLIVRIDNEAIWNRKVQFKNELQRDPAVATVSLMTGEPGGFHDTYGFEAEGKPGEKLMFHTEFADFEYVRTLGVKIIAGRDFLPEFRTDSTQSVLINRSAAGFLGYTPEEAVGKWVRNITQDSIRRIVVGVVEDYHFASLKQIIGPLVISTREGDRRLALIKIQTGDLPQAVERIKKLYDNAAPGYPFEYSFLDESFDRLYQSEIKQETLLGVFAVIAISIACLGLFGLASYTALKRTKEIGVRKVLGSSVENIIVLLSKDLLKPVLMAICIAIPVAYYVMNQWLQNFAYKTPLSWWIFVVAAILSFVIALLTVSIQAIRAAVANPVESLRNE